MDQATYQFLQSPFKGGEKRKLVTPEARELAWRFQLNQWLFIVNQEIQLAREHIGDTNRIVDVLIDIRSRVEAASNASEPMIAEAVNNIRELADDLEAFDEALAVGASAQGGTGAFHFFCQLAGQLLAELRFVLPFHLHPYDRQIDYGEPAIAAEFQSYVRWQEHAIDSIVEGETSAKRSADLQRIGRRMILVQQDAGKASSDLATVREEVSRLQTEQQVLRQEVLLTEHSFATVKDRIEMAEFEMREQLGLRETRRLWGRRAVRAGIGYYTSLFLLLAVLTGAPVAAYLYREEVLSLLSEIERNVINVQSVPKEGVAATLIAFGRLLLIGVPIGFVVWAIKLIVRYNNRSLLLMDDASQRITMLNTYLFLIKQGAATLQDRGALLEAMFRRAPGHGPETIDPPSMTDIMKYGQDLPKVGG
ncbi:hypothetical protein AB9E29_28195 [Rhizobium leguminosarum]|uniref:hypothetical protein n=1 Tax=Rhizobium leguminosarum TaxID=384 RepID=UPI0013D9FE82|nr:hypothetical protein [Rhizobium leguminosarum]NEK39335.1 hypothetical protein [Rhizobium leguminosarum]